MRDRRNDRSPDPVSERPTQGQARLVARAVCTYGIGAPVDAFIPVQTGPGKAAPVFERIRSLEGVIDAQRVTGAYDVIARVRAADPQPECSLPRPPEGARRCAQSPSLAGHAEAWECRVMVEGIRVRTTTPGRRSLSRIRRRGTAGVLTRTCGPLQTHRFRR